MKARSCPRAAPDVHRGGPHCTVAAALGSARLLLGLLYQVRPTDPATLVGVLLLQVATFAAYVPAWRAAAVDSVTAVRS